jgi:predicted nucleic-acid-binding protein
MIGLDTNVVVRFLTHDDPPQTAAALRLMNSLSPGSPGFVSLVVIAEIVWVLKIRYGYTKKEIEQVLDGLLRSKELVIERAEIVSQALRKFSGSRTDFADCLIERCGNAAGCEHTFTLDRNAAGAGMRLIDPFCFSGRTAP